MKINEAHIFILLYTLDFLIEVSQVVVLLLNRWDHGRFYTLIFGFHKFRHKEEPQVEEARNGPDGSKVAMFAMMDIYGIQDMLFLHGEGKPTHLLWSQIYTRFKEHLWTW